MVKETPSPMDNNRSRSTSLVAETPFIRRSFQPVPKDNNHSRNTSLVAETPFFTRSLPGNSFMAFLSIHFFNITIKIAAPPLTFVSETPMRETEVRKSPRLLSLSQESVGNKLTSRYGITHYLKEISLIPILHLSM